jgi:CHASE3 domain sensor protein
MLTLEGYMRAGGVHRALAQRADEIYNQLSLDQQRIARRALLRLTQPGEGTEDTRRRALRNELAPADGDESFDEVLGRLVDARLLTTGRDETGQEVVDVSHEALIRGWPRLRNWIDADRAGLLIHRRLTDAAHEWDTLKREPAALYRGARLAGAREWAAEHADDLSVAERDFLTASQANEHSEAEAGRRTTRRLRGLASGLAVLTVVAAILAAWAFSQRNDAQRQRNDAQRQLAEATLVGLENSVITIENGLRGYVASRQRRLLQPVNDALRRYPEQERELARLMSNNGDQRERVSSLASNIQDYVDLWAQPVIGLASDHPERARSALLADDRNPNPSNNPRLTSIQQKLARLRALIGTHQQVPEWGSAWLIILGIGGLMAVLLAVAAGLHRTRQANGESRPHGGSQVPGRGVDVRRSSRR